MKKIRYNLLQSFNSDGTEILSAVVLNYNETNLKIAEAEAFNGEYVIEEDKNSSEVVQKPSQLDIIEAQVTYTALMTDTLLPIE